MKRQTFIEYSKVIAVSLVITFVTAIFGVVGYFLDNKTIPTKQTAVIRENLPTIVIDAGHGGEDGGAVGISGSLEKNINLEISEYLRDLFMLTDINVIMTRHDDNLLYEAGQESRKKFNDLNNRLKICSTVDNPLLISIHQNKFPLQKYKGLQVYYAEKNADSKNIANIVQNKTKNFIQKDNNRQIKPAGRSIFILNRASCPAVLIECGFLSNPEDEANLMNPEYQKKLAFVIFSSVMDYLESNSNY